MKTKMICKKLDYNTQAFYAVIDGKEYFLFERPYSSMTREFFKYGYYLMDNPDYSKIKSHAIKEILDKAYRCLKNMENEYSLTIYNKSKNKRNSNKKKRIRTNNYLTDKEVWDCVYDLAN